MSPFYMQVYDDNQVVVANAQAGSIESLDKAFRAACESSPPGYWVKAFLAGQPEPLVYAYIGSSNFKQFIWMIPPGQYKH